MKDKMLEKTDKKRIIISHLLDLGPELKPEIEEYAIRNGEDPKLRPILIQELRKMVYDKGECMPYRMDDEMLIKFLRARSWKIHASYHLLRRYCEFRADNPAFFKNVRVSSLRAMGDYDAVSVPPYKDQCGRRMLIIRLANWRPDLMPVEDIFRLAYLVLELGMCEPQTQVLGAVGIFDVRGLKLSHLRYITPSVPYKVIQMLVTHFPVKIHAAHVVNNGWMFETLYQMFKHFINDRMRQKIYFHGTNMQSLHKHIDPLHLPVRYGGALKEYPYYKWLQRLKYNQKVVNMVEQMGYMILPEDLDSVPDDSEEDEQEYLECAF